MTGKCECHPGVGGATCDSCEEHHFGFSSSGCQSEYLQNMPVFITLYSGVSYNHYRLGFGRDTGNVNIGVVVFNKFVW